MRVLGVIAVGIVASLISVQAGAYWITDNPTKDTAVVATARTLYSATNVSVYNASSENFNEVFGSTYSLYFVIVSDSDTVVHLMGYQNTTNTSYDLTKDFNTMLTGAGFAILNSTNALAVAKVYAELANPEIQGWREVVTSVNATDLGGNVTDPSVSSGLGTWAVALWTWTPENGVVANWTVEMNLASVTHGEWRVNGTGRGTHFSDLRAWDLRPGTAITNLYPTYGLSAYRVSGATTVNLVFPPFPESQFTYYTTVSNDDGTNWSVYYHGNAVPPVALQDRIDKLATSATRAHNLHIGTTTASCGGQSGPVYNSSSLNWNFTRNSSSCELKLYNETDFVNHGGDTNLTRIAVSPFYWEQSFALVDWNRNLNFSMQDVADYLMAHEHFHWVEMHSMGPLARTGDGSALLVRTLNNHDFTGPGIGFDSLNEGMARFSETLSVPNITSQSPSDWYSDVNQFLASPSRAMCSQGYPYAILWGYLFANDGGLPIIKNTMTHLYGQMDVSAGNCTARLPSAMTIALAGTNGAHDNISDALADFAYAIYARDLSWAPPNATWDGATKSFATYLADPTNASLSSGTGGYDVGAFGLEFVALPTTSTYTVSCPQGNEWTIQLFLKDTSGVRSRATPTCAGQSVAGGSYSEVLLVGLNRLDHLQHLSVTVS